MTYYWANQRALPVSSVTPKTPFGAARTHMIVHRVVAARGLWLDGRLTVQAEWQCGDGSHDVVLLARVEDGGSQCSRCADQESGPGIYRCFDDADRLLYIGSSKAVAGRLRSHVTQSPWWPQVARVAVEPHPDVTSARTAESRAIQAERPLHNRVGTRRLFHERASTA